MARIDSFLRLVAEQGASDLHFHSGNVPIIRYEGELMPLPFRVLSELETSRFLLELLAEDQRGEFEKTQEADLVYVISIEDPIEFLHQPIKGAITQRQVGKHAESFSSALRSALRESPDVLVVGEMRDLETIHLAIAAAETGVLVIGTLHSNSAAKAIDRIIDVIPEESRDQVRSTLSVLLRGVISQHLAKHASGEGRVAVMEVLLQSYAVANLIRENKIFQIDGYLDSASNDGSGMQSLDASLFRLLKQGEITVEEAIKLANLPESLKRLAAEMQEE